MDTLRKLLGVAGLLAVITNVAHAQQLRVLDVHKLEPTKYWQKCVQQYQGGTMQIGLKSSYPPTVRSHESIARAIAELGWSSVSGYTADGASLLLLAYKAPEAGCVTFELYDGGTTHAPESSVGRLRNSFHKQETGNGLVVYTHKLSYMKNGHRVQEEWAFAELLAPENFVRNSSDNNLRTRPVSIEASFQRTSDCGTSNFPYPPQYKDLQLYRPPVVMVHGIFSSSGMWNETAWQPLFGSNAYPASDVKRVDYSKTNAKSFATNRKVVPKAISESIAKRRKAGIATTKVDVIGHSMGGLLARLFAENGHPYPSGPEKSWIYRRRENHWLGDIHKLVTLDSPHYGSHWADLIGYLDDNYFGAHYIIKKLGDWAHKPPFDGAAMDMRWDSHDTFYMRDAEVPAHALVGTGGKVVTTGMNVTVEAFIKTNYFYFFGALSVYVPFGPFASFVNGSWMFNGLEHDTVVSEPSQKGGLTGGKTTTYATPSLEMTHTSFGSVPNLCGGVPPCWVGVGSSPTMATRFLSLLQASVTTATFASKFPGTGHMPPPAPPAAPPGGGGGIPPAPPPQLLGLEIVTPLPNASFPGGATVAVKVRPIQGFTPQYVVIVVGDVLYEPPFDPPTGTYNINVTIPLAALGAVPINALGVAQNGSASSAGVTVNATLPSGASLLGIAVDPFPLDLWNSSEAPQLVVHGIYNDTTRDITTQPGTTYVSQDPSIATVSSTGFVTGVALGSTQVTVARSGFTFVVAVNVYEIKGDYDGDGDVDNQDFGAFMGCFTGPSGSGSFETTGTVCLLTFDFDGDSDVDAADYDLFLLAFTGTLGLDCNANGVDDMDDIFAGTSTDCDHDGVPDTCGSTDCNGNGIADSCDIEPEDFGFDDATSFVGAANVTPSTVVLGDFDGDGDRDVAVCHPGSAIGVHMNLGNGAFASGVGNSGSPVGTQLTNIAAANIDGVGGDELLACADHPTNSTSDVLVVLKNCVNGVFQNSYTFTLPGGMPSVSGPRALVAGNFTTDTKPDVALAMGTLPGAATPAGKVFVLVNTSTSTTINFAGATQYNAQGGARAIVTTDVDRDNKLDLVVANYNTVTPTHSVVILRGNGNGTFVNPGSRTIYTGFSRPLALAAGDMNGDGWPEIGVANEATGDIDLLVNVGVATSIQFTFSPGAAHASDPRAIAAGDMDGDGRTDLVVADAFLGGIQVLRMQCLGCSFWGAASADEFDYLTPTATRGVAVGDLDGDGDLDVATSDVAASGQTISELGFLRNHVIPPFSLDADADGVPDECAPDCNNNGKFDTCDIALGLLTDCNENLLADACEPLNPTNDCNANGVLDACEISGGTALDCDGNGVIDSCDIAAGTPDCNSNGVPDSCDIGSLYSVTSPMIQHIYFGSPQSHTFVSPPPATSDPVTLHFAANADFAAAYHRIQIRLNTTILGDAYTANYFGCDSPYGPDEFTMTISASWYNQIKGTGNVVITMTPGGTASTGMQECSGSPSWIEVTLEYSDAYSLDVNHNGIPDECPGG